MERVHIAFFGLRNVGKSSLVNAITSQNLSVVSEVKGTTTDPVKKSMELLPIGPVVIIDTAGLDDVGELGKLRMKKTMEVLHQTDIAVVVKDACSFSSSREEREHHTLFLALEERKIPYIVVWNKIDIVHLVTEAENEIAVSARTGENIFECKELIAKYAKKKLSQLEEKKILADLVKAGDSIVLVMPQDGSAPSKRLILPQQQVLRELLDLHCTVISCQDDDLEHTLSMLREDPKLVITDSKVFGQVNQILPDHVPLTSFSILFARYKGNLSKMLEGASILSELQDGDKVLISEGCTHHRQCEDIGTVKMPDWIQKYSKSKPDFHFTSGGTFPDEEELSQYRLVVHCGGCMLNEAQMKSRLMAAGKVNLPMVNYGMAIAKMNGMLDRTIQIFSEK